MVLLTKEQTMFPADKEGKLKTLTVKVVTPIHDSYPEVEFYPLLRTEYRDMLQNEIKIEDGDGKTTSDFDKKLVIKKFVNPSYNQEESELIPVNILSSFVKTIMEYSGITEGKLIKIRDDLLKKEENDEQGRKRKSSTQKTQLPDE